MSEVGTRIAVMDQGGNGQELLAGEEGQEAEGEERKRRRERRRRTLGRRTSRGTLGTT